MKNKIEKVFTHIRSDNAIRSKCILHNKISKFHNDVPVSKLMNRCAEVWSLLHANNKQEHNEKQSRQ